MALSKDEKEKKRFLTPMVYLKALFLIVLTVFGMVVLSRLSGGIARNEPGEPETIKSIKNIQETLTGDEIAQAIDTEIRTNETYKSTINTARQKSDEVLGEAVKLKDQAIQDSKDYISDYLYEQTVGSMINGLLEKLPDRQKEKVLQNICKQ